MKIIVCVSSQATWALGIFAKLWQRYCGDEQVMVAAENLPAVQSLKLPQNFHSKQVGEEWTKEQWTNGLIRYLHGIPDQFVVLMLEDYWLQRAVNWNGIRAHLLQLMLDNPNILRVDLCSDRLYAGGPKYPAHDPDWGRAGYYDLITRPGTQYQMSLQPSLWNKRLLLEILREGWSPWEFELSGDGVLAARSDLLVLGTRQNPIQFVNGLNSGQPDRVNLEGIDNTDELLSFIPAGKEVFR